MESAHRYFRIGAPLILEWTHQSTGICNDQLGGDDSPLSEAILDRIKHDAYKINIIPTDPANYRSMREVYGLDPALSE